MANRNNEQFQRLKSILMRLLIVLVVVIIIIAISSLDGIYNVIQSIFSIVGLPLIMSLLLFYLSEPIVDFIERKGMERKRSVILYFVIVLFIIIFFIAIISPTISDQFVQLVNNIPYYVEEVRLFFENFFDSEQFTVVMDYLSELNIVETLRNQWENIVSVTIGGISNVIGVAAQIVLVVFTTPFILYYMLAGQGDARNQLLKVIPTKYRNSVSSMLEDINFQLSTYIRGQLLVALIVGIMFGVMFAIIGLDYALVLGIIAGVLNMIPYFGSFVAFLIALIVAAVHSPFMVVKTLIVFGLEQLIEGRILSPLVHGANLKMHPITVLFVLLIGARFLGLLGALVSIPIFAIVKIVFQYAFDWFKRSRPELYPDETSLDNKSKSGVVEPEE